jgi:hypothetical protein
MSGRLCSVSANRRNDPPITPGRAADILVNYMSPAGCAIGRTRIAADMSLDSPSIESGPDIRPTSGSRDLREQTQDGPVFWRARGSITGTMAFAGRHGHSDQAPTR